MTPGDVISLSTALGAYGAYSAYKEDLELDGIPAPGIWEWYSDQLQDAGQSLQDTARDSWEDMLEGGVDDEKDEDGDAPKILRLCEHNQKR